MGDQQLTVRMLWSVCARYSSPEFGSQGWFAYVIYDNFDYLKRRKRKKPLTKFPSKKDKIDEECLLTTSWLVTLLQIIYL